MEPDKTPGSFHSVVSLLVVEDEEDHLDLIRRAFRDNPGFQLSSATTLAQAIKKIDACPPDLVIADWLLPDGKGEELLSFVAKNFSIPFIIMTSHGDEQLAVQMIKAGAIDYVVKSSFTFFDLPRIADRAVREFRNSIERDAVQEALVQSEEKFFRIFHGSPVLTLITRCSDQKILDLNAIFEKKTGYRRDELVGRTLTETGLWTDSRDLNAVVGILRSTGKFEGDFFRFTAKNGNKQTCLLSSILIEIDQEDCMVFTLVDVTEQEAAVAALRDSEARFHEMFELVGEAVFLVDDKTGRICEANKEAERVYGYTHDELIGLTNTGISAEPEKTQGIVEHRENGTFFIPLRYHQRKDGTLFPVEATGRFFTYKGRQMHVVACRDISTRKEAEEELQRSEEWYRRIVETAQEGIWVLDRSFQTTHLNIHMAEMLGYSQNEMKGRPITDFLHPDELSDYRIMADERRKGVPRTFERKFIRKDGSVCWGLVSSTPIFTNNVFTGSFSMITDITGRKEAEEKSVRTYYDLQKIYDNLSATEEELREQYRILSQKQQELIASEERYRQLFTSMTSGFAHHRILCDDGGIPVDYEFIDINPAFVTITGLPRDKIVHKRVLDVLPDTEASWIERYGHTALTGEPQIFELYNRVFDKYFDVSVYSPEEGEFITLFSDITQRKKMEEALIESEARYRNVVEDQTELIARTRPDGTHLFVNEAYCRYFGRERDEMIGRRFHPEIHPEDRSSLKIFFASFSQKNPMGTIDQRTITDNREIRWQRWNNRAVFDKNGKIVEIQSVGRDITDTKRAEEALLASEKKFRNLVELAQEGIWSVDAEYLTIYVNPKMADLLGYTQEEMKGRPISEFLDPSWLSSGMEYPKKQMMGLKEEFECAFRKKNNEIILASVSTGPLSDEQGTITGAIAVVMDITDKKRLQEQQQLALQRIEENIHQMAVLNDQIRNPLTIISILCEEDTPGSGEKILEQIKRIDSLVREVDKGFVLSLKIRDFLLDYHGIHISTDS